MAYTDDAVKAKLSSLNDTQDGIVTVAQWIMFHRRYTNQTAELWMGRLKESTPNKRLNLIYLANEICQQSKARRKLDFINSFAPLMADGTAIAYKGASSDVQGKLRRVVEVWRQRAIFDAPTQDAIEKQLDEVDRSRGPGKKAALGGSLFASSSSSTPTELQPLVPLQNASTRASTLSKTAVDNADLMYDQQINANPVPTPPVHAARLSTLFGTLANAETAVATSIEARKKLISSLEAMLDAHRGTLAREELQKTELGIRRTAIETRKRDVEDAIMRGLSAAETATRITPIPSRTSSITLDADPPRPEAEELTPPPVESFTPTGSPSHVPLPDVPDDVFAEPLDIPIEPTAVPAPHPPHAAHFSAPATGIVAPPGADLLSSLTGGGAASGILNGNGHPAIHPGSGGAGGGSNKKRKMSRTAAEDAFAPFVGDDAMAGIDDDVAGMLEG
ncbi:DUF618-domain-containing protein [Mytilinidion resinicola]|uniref:DUF618-domain-containing protein n=1 Tax=Mytilinidion resinicola TaxID=574789 RepID=A0A6A6Y3S1_9PEZI|nr:DUF618-domain-containing protein [Mytilinidion resinicola]KAF2803279.1 DUF618-domain-containing protein [Mytilinidion resinicola]